MYERRGVSKMLLLISERSNYEHSKNNETNLESLRNRVS